MKFEECIVELLIIDVNLAHLGLDTLASLGLERHVCFLFFDGITLSRNACVGDVGGKLKGWFLDTALPLQIVTLGAPMCGNRNSVAIAFEVKKNSRICGGDVCPLYHFRFCDQLLELGNRKTIELALFLF